MRRDHHHNSRPERLRPVTLALALLAWLGSAQLGHCQGLTKNADLEFGAIVPYSGGTVTVNPAGVRSATGGALLIMMPVSPSAATFTVSGSANASYAISLPPDGTVTLSDGANHYMAVNGFTSSPSETGVLSGGSPGTQTLRVGATLQIAAQQAVGQYTGSYDITVAFD